MTSMSSTTQRPGYTVLSGTDFGRITGYLQQPGPTSEQARDARRKALHETSKADISTWGNTIEGQRQARLAAKAKRLADKEAAQIKLDVEEAKFQNQLRKQKIRKAKGQMLQQTDMMKNFRSAMLLTEVAQERKDQTDLFAGRRAHNKEMDAQRVERMVQDIREGEEKELKDMKEARLAAMHVAGTNLDEAAAHRDARRKERIENLRMQAELDKDYIAYVDEEAQKSAALREKNLTVVRQRKQIDAHARSVKAGVAVLDLADTRKADMAKESKQEMDDEIKARMMKARKEAIKRREMLAEQLYVIEADKTAEENALIARVTAERYQKMDEIEAAKEIRRQKAVAEILGHRKNVLADKEASVQFEYEADMNERRANEEEFQIAAEHEATLYAHRRDKARAIFDKHMVDIDVHASEVAAAKDQLVNERLARENQLQKQADMFHGFANNTVAKMKEQGITELFAMNKAVNAYDEGTRMKQRPELATMDTRRRGNPYPGNSKKRLGFNW